MTMPSTLVPGDLEVAMEARNTERVRRDINTQQHQPQRLFHDELEVVAAAGGDAARRKIHAKAGAVPDSFVELAAAGREFARFLMAGGSGATRTERETGQ